VTYDLSSTFFGQHFLVGQTFFLNIFWLVKHFLVSQTFFGEGKEIYMKIYLLGLFRCSWIRSCPVYNFWELFTNCSFTILVVYNFGI